MKWAKRFDVRERFGDFLNAFEQQPRLRRQCYAVVIFGVSAAIAAFWFVPRWRADAAIKMTRQWLAAGKLDRAGETIRTAMRFGPSRVETWQVAAEYARRNDQPRLATTYLHHAASLAPTNATLALEWAAAAIVANDLAEAETALQSIAPAARDKSARAQRFAGEIFRRRGQLASARPCFEAAIRLDGPLAENELPLGIVLLSENEPASRARGLALLNRWRADPTWALEALRALLTDAMSHKDLSARPELATALLAQPGRERSDTLNALLALASSDASRFTAALDSVESAWSKDGGAAAELIGWLSGTGRGTEAVRWGKTLARELTAVPPVAVALADALRVLQDWPALKAATESGDWRDMDFLRRAYLAFAARQLGDTARADDLWKGLQAMAELDGGKGLFLAGTLYSWGWEAAAIELWWQESTQQGISVAALGSLARHFQLKRDAGGLYRVFRKLYELRAADPRIANNFAYFAALTGNNPADAQHIARGVHEQQPDDAAFCSTYVFALHRSGATDQALALLPRLLPAAETSPSIAFTCGIVLADAGRKEEARKFLGKVDERALTLQELALLKSARAAAEKI